MENRVDGKIQKLDNSFLINFRHLWAHQLANNQSNAEFSLSFHL